MPAPENEMLSEELDALLAITTLPVRLPADCGANTTLNVVLWPAARVKGKLRPLMLKPVPEGVACVMLMLEPLELVSVSGRL